MTLEERDTLLNSPSFHAKVRIALCDWLNYWAIAGTGSIQDPTIKMYTEAFMRMIIENVEECTEKVVVLAIADSNIVNAQNEPTDQNVKSAIDVIMANCLAYLM